MKSRKFPSGDNMTKFRLGHVSVKDKACQYCHTVGTKCWNKACRSVYRSENKSSQEVKSRQEDTKPNVCSFFLNSRCRFGDKCYHQHTHRPNCNGVCGGTQFCRYKRKPCRHFANTLTCPFKNNCTFAHVPACRDFMRGDCDGECSEGSHPQFVQNMYLCRFWTKYGKCTARENGMCDFEHATKHQAKCKFHLAGGCYHGSECKYYHP